MISVAQQINSGASMDKLRSPVQEKGVKPKRQRKANKKETLFFFLDSLFPQFYVKVNLFPYFFQASDIFQNSD